MSPTDAQEVVGAIGLFVLIIAVVVVSIWQIAATVRAKAVLAREGEYKALAAKAVQTQEATERQLAEIQTRLHSLERVLKDVE